MGIYSDYDIVIAARKIARGYAPCVRTEPEPAKTAQQLHHERMETASRTLRSAIDIARTGGDPRTSKALLWSYNSQSNYVKYKRHEPENLRFTDGRICRACGARAGRCSHDARWLA